MKKTLILGLMVGLVIVPAFAKLKYDEKTATFYSTYVSKKVNREYDVLARELFGDSSLSGFFNLTADEIVKVFLRLNAIGTPAAKRLSHDLKKIIKATKKDAKYLYTL